MARYSDNFRAEALAALDANGGNLRQTARATGVPLATLQDWSKNRGVSDGCSELRTQKKEALADCLEGLLRRVIGVIPEKLDSASLHEVNGTLKIGAETMQLLRGDPTSINESRQQDLTPDERAKRVAALLAGEERGGDSAPHPYPATGPAGDAVAPDAGSVAVN